MLRSGSLFLICLLSFSSCAKEGIPLLGLDDKGAFLEKYVSPDIMRSQLKAATTQVGESAFTALEASPADTSASLRAISVGLGFNFEFGIGKFITMGVSPKVCFAFSNAKNPIIPH